MCVCVCVCVCVRTALDRQVEQAVCLKSSSSSKLSFVKIARVYSCLCVCGVCVCWGREGGGGGGGVLLYLYVGEHIKPEQPYGETCFYSATITLVPPVTLVLHGSLPLHPLYNIHICCFTIYDIPFLLSKFF